MFSNNGNANHGDNGANNNDNATDDDNLHDNSDMMMARHMVTMLKLTTRITMVISIASTKRTATTIVAKRTMGNARNAINLIVPHKAVYGQDNAGNHVYVNTHIIFKTTYKYDDARQHKRDNDNDGNADENSGNI